MKIVIIGAGKVGYQLARYLSREKNDIIVIDSRQELINLVNDTLDVIAYLGTGIDIKLLEKIGLGDCDMIIAVTRSDETNMIACQIAYSIFDVDTRIARIRAPHLYQSNSIRLFSPDHIPINLAISPENEVAKSIIRRIKLPGTSEIIPIAHNSQDDEEGKENALLIGVKCRSDCPLIHTPLRQLSALFPDLQLTVLSIIRNETAFMPNSDDEIMPDDIVYFSTALNHVKRGLAAFGHKERQGNKLTILGGGLICQRLVESLDKLPFIKRCRIIERNAKQAKIIARKYPDVTVLHGNATDLDLLEDLSIDKGEIVVAVTNNDEANIVAASLYKWHGCDTSIALVNNDRLTSIIENFAIDGVINPRSITISSLLRYIRRGRIHKAFTLRDGFAECLEGEVLRGSPLAGITIKDLDLPSDIKIASILRLEKFIAPRPNCLIEEGDIVAIISLAKSVKIAQRLLAIKAETF